MSETPTSGTPTSGTPTSIAAGASPVELQAVTLGYGREPVSTYLDLAIPSGELTMVIGPNGCGKSTALRAMARLLPPRAGTVLLDGRDIKELSTRQVARRLGLLPQQSIAPDGIRVAELVARGRHPHQGPFRQWSETDETAVAEAMERTGVTPYSSLPVDQLSGGQRQRVWIAMVLAQETPLLLLDEPTTFLDLTHQLEVLDLCQHLTHDGDRTIAAVMHDLDHACRYADHLIAMRNGTVIAAGPPAEIVTTELIRDVFDVEAMIIRDPVSATPLVIPMIQRWSYQRG
ncbi:MAG: ATP-binding cassette domain-containing protein [Pseudonocardiaceae bacterium]|nr:ATP-binding cassette domain-containing protein [Pseudonocardiaceae bacterium]